MSENKEQPRKRGKKEKKRMNKVALGIIVAGIVAVVGAYSVKANTYRTRFFPHTVINGIDASEKTVDEVRQVMSNQIDNFESTIKSRGNNDEIIKGSDVGLAFVKDNSLEDLLKEQNSMAWIAEVNGKRDLKIKSSFTVDPDKFENTVSKLKALDESKFERPVDARISDFVPGSGYSIIPEVEGNAIDIAKAKEYIKSQLITLNSDINLDYEDNDLYEKPAKRADDPTLNTALNNLNKYISARISYDKLNVLNGDTIHNWLSVNSDGSVSISDEGVASFVKKVSNAYNTVGKPKT